jgi:hypothetical protein
MKSRIKNVSVLLATGGLAVCLSGCTIGAIALVGYHVMNKEKTFTKEGMSITLTAQFEEEELATQTCYYKSPQVSVVGLKEEFEDDAELCDYTLEVYTEETIEERDLETEYEMSKDGYTYFTYEKELGGDDYVYLATCHKTDDAFWLIQFWCESDDYDKMEDKIFKYADSITFEVEKAV